MTLDDDDILDELNIDRRTTLQGLAGVLGTSVVGGGVASAQESQSALNPDQRWTEHLELGQDKRDWVVENLIEDLSGSSSPNERNNDSDVVVTQGSTDYLPFVYSKALGYDSRVGISTSRRNEFIDALANAGTDYPLGEAEGTGDRPQVSPLSMNSHGTEGTDPWLGTVPPAYPASNANDDPERRNTYLQMLETYATAYFRQTPLTDLAAGPDAVGSAFTNDRDALLSGLANAGASTTMGDWIQSPTASPDTAFRDQFYGCQTGPYVTQHLAHPIDLFGPQVTTEPTIAPITSDPYGATFEAFEAIRGGETPGVEPGHENYNVGDPDFGPELASSERWPHTGQDLATYVREDPAYIHYFNAALQLLGWGAPIDDSMPYATGETDIVGYIDAGGPAILDLLARVTRNALIASWHQKWRVHRRIRPESYAEKIITAYNATSDATSDATSNTTSEESGSNQPLTTPPLSDLLGFLANDSEMIAEVATNGAGDGLLPLAYPEGGPAHPAYPSGHSVIAGASATALKTFMENVSYDELDVDPRVNTDGTDSGFEAVSADLDVHGEINKYASNVGMGRIFAGVHYRADHVYGMLLGEQIAVATLYDHFISNTGDRSGDQIDQAEPDQRLTFTTLIGGEQREISPETFDDLRQAALDRSGLRP